MSEDSLPHSINLSGGSILNSVPVQTSPAMSISSIRRRRAASSGHASINRTLGRVDANSYRRRSLSGRARAGQNTNARRSRRRQNRVMPQPKARNQDDNDGNNTATTNQQNNGSNNAAGGNPPEQPSRFWELLMEVLIHMGGISVMLYCLMFLAPRFVDWVITALMDPDN